ncbi:hypothetical protein NL676_007090 [Syzygium grande]|nr:hypothetical protein NL676_007090 [Syzygium grande]
MVGYKRRESGLDGRAADIAVVKIKTAVVFMVHCGFVGAGATTKARLFNWGHHRSAEENSNVVAGTGSSATLDCRQGSSTESWNWRNSVVAMETHAQERGRLFSPFFTLSCFLLFL